MFRVVRAPAVATAFALTATFACAHDAEPVTPARPPAEQTAVAAASPPTVHVPAGTQVQIEVADTVDSERSKLGDKFRIRLAAPVEVGGKTVIPAGVVGEGEVIDASSTGPLSRGGKLVLTAKYIDYNKQHITLKAFDYLAVEPETMTVRNIMEEAFADTITTQQGVYANESRRRNAVGTAITVRPGARTMAKLAADVDLTVIDDASGTSAQTLPLTTIMDDRVRKPAPGQGLIVFFRAPAIEGAIANYTIRDGYTDTDVVRLSNNSYAMADISPGKHTYVAKGPAAGHDVLTLQIDEGETYFVRTNFSAGEFMLYPVSQAAFSKFVRLKPSKLISTDTSKTGKQAGSK